MNENINWADAFKNEGFVRELTRFIEDTLDKHSATDEDIDEIIESIFTYDKDAECLRINSQNNKDGVQMDIIRNCDDGSEQTEEEKLEIGQKLRMKLLLDLMLDNGLMLDKNNMSNDKSKSKKQNNRGNGERAATIMHMITGIPKQTCKNFISNQKISGKIADDDKTQLNNLLINSGLKIRI